MKRIERKILIAAKKLVQSKDLCAFATIGLDGFPKMRYMGAFVGEKQWVFYLVSLSDSQKMLEIEKNEKAQLIFWSPDFQKVVSLWGTAGVVREQSKRREVYDQTAPLKIYPQFSSDFGVIQFVSLRLEYLNLHIRNDAFKVVLN